MLDCGREAMCVSTEKATTIEAVFCFNVHLGSCLDGSETKVVATSHRAYTEAGRGETQVCKFQAAGPLHHYATPTYATPDGHPTLSQTDTRRIDPDADKIDMETDKWRFVIIKTCKTEY